MLKKIFTILFAGFLLSFAFANNPPVLDPVGDLDFDEGDSLTITVSGTDVDDDPLSFLCVPSLNINCIVTKLHFC